jgi:HSP20 family protein
VHEREGRFHRIERSYGTFQRALNLPPNVDQERIEARFKNGVLTITIAKKEGIGSKGRVIPIQ